MASLLSNHRSDGQAFTGAALETYMVDMNTDPYEKTDLLRTMTESTEQLFDNFQDRIQYWRQKVGPVEVPTADLKKQSWKRANGIVPWVEDETYIRETPALKYSNPSAPHIVFILIDDWGWNDIGYQSTWLSWTTPTIDRLAQQGVKLSNYWTSCLCAPSRGSLMTGRYPFRLGLSEEKAGGELPLSEVTLAEELKSAGYRTNLVGKWHLGMSSAARTPMHRGFDYFYGFLNGFVDYWTKEYSGYLDLQNGEVLETDPTLISSELHNAYLMSWKTIETINNHAENYKNQPMFLYVAMQLIHEDWAAPTLFIDRCNDGGASPDRALYCAMNLMIDEVVTNITCALNRNGMADNTVLILASDNGGVQTMPGNNHPLKGSKGSFFRGGLSAPAFIHGSIVPTALQGSEYNGEMHVTDWLPTLMGIATNYQWQQGLYGQEIDGMDMWPTIMASAPSPHTEIVHYMDEYGNCSIQIDMIKYDYNYFVTNTWQFAEYSFTSDQRADLMFPLCNVPTLIDYLALTASGGEMEIKEMSLVFEPSSTTTVASNSIGTGGPPTKKPTGRVATGSPTVAVTIATPDISPATATTTITTAVTDPSSVPFASTVSATTTAAATTATTVSSSIPFASAAPITASFVPVPGGIVVPPTPTSSTSNTGAVSSVAVSVSSSLPSFGTALSAIGSLPPPIGGGIGGGAAAAAETTMVPAFAIGNGLPTTPLMASSNPVLPPIEEESSSIETTATTTTATTAPLMESSTPASPPIEEASMPIETATAATTEELPPNGVDSPIYEPPPYDEPPTETDTVNIADSSTTSSSDNSDVLISTSSTPPLITTFSTTIASSSSSPPPPPELSSSEKVVGAFISPGDAVISSGLSTSRGRVSASGGSGSSAGISTVKVVVASSSQDSSEVIAAAAINNSNSIYDNAGKYLALVLIAIAGVTFGTVIVCTARTRRKTGSRGLHTTAVADTNFDRKEYGYVLPSNVSKVDKIASPYGSCENDGLLSSSSESEVLVCNNI